MKTKLPCCEETVTWLVGRKLQEKRIELLWLLATKKFSSAPAGDESSNPDAGASEANDTKGREP